jgi:hypothetical protein
MRSLYELVLEFKFKSKQIFLSGIRISRGAARILVSGKISEISLEKKNPGLSQIYRRIPP